MNVITEEYEVGKQMWTKGKLTLWRGPHNLERNDKKKKTLQAVLRLELRGVIRPG